MYVCRRCGRPPRRLLRSVKSSLKCTRRKELCSVSFELAGPPGDVFFARLRAVAMAQRPFRHCTAHLNVQAGLLAAMHSCPQEISE